MPEKMRNARRERLKAFKKYSRQGWTEIPRMDELTDEQWELVQQYLPPENSHGRPSQDARKVLNGILFYIRNALTWANIPPDYPSYVTLFRRYHKWMESGVLEQVINALTRHLSKTSGLDYEEALRNKTLSFHQQNGTLTIYLPQEYASYWMQPTATLLLMWLVTCTLNIYTEAYRRSCKEQHVDRLLDQEGPRKVRPRSVEVVVAPNPAKVGSNPDKKMVEKPNFHRDRLEFLDRVSRE
jgi:transposase